MAETTIKFAGKAYTVRPLTVAQLRVLMPAFLRVNTATEEGVDAMIDVLLETLRRSDPALTRDALLAAETDMREMRHAVEAIAILSGLEMTASPGEAPAAESIG